MLHALARFNMDTLDASSVHVCVLHVLCNEVVLRYVTISGMQDTTFTSVWVECLKNSTYVQSILVACSIHHEPAYRITGSGRIVRSMKHSKRELQQSCSVHSRPSAVASR